MKKGTKILIIILAALVVSAGIIYLSVFRNDYKHLTVIPDDATVVASVNVVSVVRGLEIKEILEQPVVKDLMEEAKAENPDRSEFINGTLKSPLSWGVNILEPVFVFSKDLEYTAMTLRISSSKKFQKVAEEFIEINEIDAKVKENDDFKYIDFDEASKNYTIAWSKKALVIIFNNYTADDNEDLMEDFFTNKKDKSILSNKSFKKFLKKSEDINLWVNYNEYIDVLKESADEIDLDVDFKDCSTGIFLDFTKGAITVNSTNYFNKSVEKLIKDLDFEVKNIDESIMQNIPENPLAVVYNNNCLAEIFTFMEENIDEDVYEDIEESLEDFMDIDDLSADLSHPIIMSANGIVTTIEKSEALFSFEEYLSIIMEVEIDELSAEDYEMYETDYNDMYGASEIEVSNIYASAFTQTSEDVSDILTELVEDYIDDDNIKVSYDNDIFRVDYYGDPADLKMIEGKEVLGTEIPKSMLYALVNLNNPELLAYVIEEGAGYDSEDIMPYITDFFGLLTVELDQQGELEIIINFNDKKTNALQQLIMKALVIVDESGL